MASALSCTAWMTDPTSSLVIARIAASGDEGLEQERILTVVGVVALLVTLRRHDEVRPDRAQDVGSVSLETVLGEEIVELVVGARLDGGLQQIGLAGEPAVDRPRGQTGPAGDLLDPCPVVALLGEHRGGGIEPAIASSITRLDNGHHRRR